MQLHAPVAAISAGNLNSFCVQSDGSIWPTGENSKGQLGDGSKLDKHLPLRVDLSRTPAIAAGGIHSCCLMPDGTAWASGSNEDGQLGDSSLTQQATPIAVMTDVVAIAAGPNHTLLLQK